jgi:molybdopterin-guanine dinucleotide biosynthesis protein A
VSVTGIVLAGGRSSRFGADKLLADLDGQTLLAATIGVVASVAERVIVAGPPLADGNRPDAQVVFVSDVEPFAGPLVVLANVLEGLEADPSDLAIVVGGDMPALVPDVLRTMLDRLDEEPRVDAVTLEGPSGAAGQSPPTQILPLALRVPAARQTARSVVEGGRRSLVSLLDGLAHAELPAVRWQALDPAAKSLLDVDTPTDLEDVRRRVAQ